MIPDAVAGRGYTYLKVVKRMYLAMRTETPHEQSRWYTSKL
jgi:hypothetical protein